MEPHIIFEDIRVLKQGVKRNGGQLTVIKWILLIGLAAVIIGYLIG